jgi:hypothetical protein
MDQKLPQRKIVSGPKYTLHEILASQLEMLKMVAIQRPLDREELQRLDVLLKLFDRLSPDQQASEPGITISIKAPTKKELDALLRIAEKE